MKLRHITSLSLAALAVSGIIWSSGCQPAWNGKIPINEDSARLNIISASLGKSYIRSYKAADTELMHIVKDSFLNHFQLPIAEAFNRDAIAALLNVDGAVAIRVYLGRDDLGQVRMVLVPMDKNGNDIITQLVKPGAQSDTTKQPRVEEKAASSGSGQVVDNGQRCPTMCDSSN